MTGVIGSHLSKFLGEIDSHTNSYFRGLYSVSQIVNVESLLDLNKMNIVCLHSNNHYYGVFLSPTDNKSVFVDSVRLQPHNYSTDLVEFLDYYCNRYKQLPFRVQGSQSNLCALYLIYFMHMLSSGASLDECCSIFKPFRFHYNDSILQNWFTKTFNLLERESLFPRK